MPLILPPGASQPELPLEFADGTPVPTLAELAGGVTLRRIPEDEQGDDTRDCARCDDPCATLSGRDWCDGCEAEAARPAA